MKVTIRDSKDFFSGLIFLFFGGFAAIGARSYPLGTAARMGPGYFPTVLGGLLALLGAVIMARGLGVSGDPAKGWVLQPLLLVLAGVVAFALSVERLGMVAAVLALTIISCAGGTEFRLREVVALFLVLAALAVGIFVYGLGLPLKVWPI